MSGHFEAKKHAIRQTQDGWVVSFVVHPNDLTADFAVAPLGTRYMVAFAQIGDDEQPVARLQPGAGAEPERIANRAEGPALLPPSGRDDAGGRTVGSIPATGAKPIDLARSEQGKARYAAASDMEKALVRAARLSTDTRFRKWLTARPGHWTGTEDNAIHYIRERCCGGASRKLIAEDEICYTAFLELETEYLMQTGQLAEPR